MYLCALFLVLDTPPGSSDEHLTIVKLLQQARPSGAILVTTPQRASLLALAREIQFCQKVGLPIVGIVENMTDFECPCCKVRALATILEVAAAQTSHHPLFFRKRRKSSKAAPKNWKRNILCPTWPACPSYSRSRRRVTRDAVSLTTPRSPSASLRLPMTSGLVLLLADFPRASYWPASCACIIGAYCSLFN